MKYMLLIYGNDDVWGSVSPEEFQQIVAETDAQNRALFESGEMVGAYGVAEPVNAMVVRTGPEGRTDTDGPFIETKEYLGSFTIVECDSLDRALEIAAQNPAARYFGGVEVRPLTHEAADHDA
jgi:hypothetical protein